MAQHHSPREYLEEARSEKTSPERLDILAETEWEFVRAAVAANPNTSVRTLVGLMPIGERLLDEPLALAIARRADASPETLQQLAERFQRCGWTAGWSNRGVGFDLGLALLSNSSTPDGAITKLLDPACTSTHFRARAASTIRRPEVLEKLCRDVSEKVQKRARQSLMNCHAAEEKSEISE